MEESGLFEEPSSRPAKETDGTTIEQRLDAFSDLAKEATQLAGKVRLNLNKLAESARLGVVASAPAQIARLSQAAAELSSFVDRLKIADESTALRGRRSEVQEYVRELETQLVKKGVKVTKGPAPYWLAYPAWFKVEHDDKGSLGVVLNGERLDSVRPSLVAAKIAEVVSEKFQSKQFADLLIDVRNLLRRLGAAGGSLVLDDVYEVLAMQPGRRTVRGKEFSKAAFYYSVHRLAEELERTPRPAMSFPPANRPDNIFFTQEGESRKYLIVEFAGGSPQ